jgi:hypothetical protein
MPKAAPTNKSDPNKGTSVFNKLFSKVKKAFGSNDKAATSSAPADTLKEDVRGTNSTSATTPRDASTPGSAPASGSAPMSGGSAAPKDATPIIDSKPSEIPHSLNTPIWVSALKEFKEKHRKEHEILEAVVKRVDKSCIADWNGLFGLSIPARLDERNNTPAIVQRIKTYLPCLGLLKGIAMTAAAFDPHKIAPIACAAVFFSVEVCR